MPCTSGYLIVVMELPDVDRILEVNITVYFNSILEFSQMRNITSLVTVLAICNVVLNILFSFSVSYMTGL